MTVVKTNFSRLADENFTDKKQGKLSETPQALFICTSQFAIYQKVQNGVKLYLVEDLVENIQTGYCGVFQLYFYEILFGPNIKSQVLDHENLTRNTVPANIFSLNQNENEGILRYYINPRNINFD